MNEDNWTAAFEAIDRAFARSPRPEKFTDHPYCDECAEAHEYFSTFMPATLAAVTDPPETLPIAFLTDEAFHFLLPGMLRWLPRTGRQYWSVTPSSMSKAASTRSTPCSASRFATSYTSCTTGLNPRSGRPPSITPLSGASSTS